MDAHCFENPFRSPIKKVWTQGWENGQQCQSDFKCGSSWTRPAIALSQLGHGLRPPNGKPQIFITQVYIIHGIAHRKGPKWEDQNK